MAALAPPEGKLTGTTMSQTFLEGWYEAARTAPDFFWTAF